MMAVAEGFEPNSATWSEPRKPPDPQKDITVIHSSYLQLRQVCVQTVSTEARWSPGVWSCSGFGKARWTVYGARIDAELHRDDTRHGLADPLVLDS
jgi:hypothetical protein